VCGAACGVRKEVREEVGPQRRLAGKLRVSGARLCIRQRMHTSGIRQRMLTYAYADVCMRTATGAGMAVALNVSWASMCIRQNTSAYVSVC
jgi:hypothetical protein